MRKLFKNCFNILDYYSIYIQKKNIWKREQISFKLLEKKNYNIMNLNLIYLKQDNSNS
jgi:hypothetical protein